MISVWSLGGVNPPQTPFASATVVLPASSYAAQPHIPTEEELDRRLGRMKEEPDRQYQRDSVASFGTKAQRAATWVKTRLAGMHVTPARLLLGLGLLGIVITWNKNKHKVPWAVLAVFSYLLAVFGGAAIFFDWPFFN